MLSLDRPGPSIAIIGSGPSGCFLASFLIKTTPRAEITIFDRLPVPYGLVRYGVAADHQGTKSVTRQFDRFFMDGSIKFVGNVELGVDIDLNTLQENFDIVVLATGVHADRTLNVEGEHRTNVYRAGTLTRLLNSHPDEHIENNALGRRVVIVGNGNVALDILRILIHTKNGLSGSDVNDEALARLQTSFIREIYVVGRSPAEYAKFSGPGIRELSRVEGVEFNVGDVPAAIERSASESEDPLLAAIRMLELKKDSIQKRLSVNFRFGWSPLRIDSEGIVFESSAGEKVELTIATDSIITAVGFTHRDLRWHRDIPQPDEWADPTVGKIRDRLYCTGWFRRGPQGTIPENRSDARQVSAAIAASFAGNNQGWRPGLEGLSRELIEKSVTFDGWKAIDRAELAAAIDGRIRRKISDWGELLRVARCGDSDTSTGVETC
jgi:ferredoxin/flavodoxin---NADP+ reductase